VKGATGGLPTSAISVAVVSVAERCSALAYPRPAIASTSRKTPSASCRRGSAPLSGHDASTLGTSTRSTHANSAIPSPSQQQRFPHIKFTSFKRQQNDLLITGSHAFVIFLLGAEKDARGLRNEQACPYSKIPTGSNLLPCRWGDQGWQGDPSPKA